MNPSIQIDVRLIYILLGLMGVALLLALALLGWVFWRIRRIQLPPDADVLTTLRATPLSIVILLDLLDFALDVFSAPISWIILTRMGLGPLRWVAVIKDLIPFTQFIPAMTVGWLIARILPPDQTLSGLSKLPFTSVLRKRD